MEKEQFVDVVKKLRVKIESGEHAKCTCPKED